METKAFLWGLVVLTKQAGAWCIYLSLFIHFCGSVPAGEHRSLFVLRACTVRRSVSWQTTWLLLFVTLISVILFFNAAALNRFCLVSLYNTGQIYRHTCWCTDMLLEAWWGEISSKSRWKSKHYTSEINVAEMYIFKWPLRFLLRHCRSPPRVWETLL